MSCDYYVICRETKEYVWLGKFYEFDGSYISFKRAWNDLDSDFWKEDRAESRIGFYQAMQILFFLKRNEGKVVEIIFGEEFSDEVYGEQEYWQGLWYS